MDFVSYLMILIGILLKMIDDHYDMKIYDNNIMYLVQIIIALLCSYIFFKNKNITLIAFITCIYVLFAEGEMSDCNGKSVIVYYIFSVITLAFFTYQLMTEGYNDTFKIITQDSKELIRILVFGLFIYFENEWFPEDISKRKIVMRFNLLLLSLLYIYYEEHYNYRSLIMRYIHLAGVGYMGTSLINMVYSTL